MNAKKLYSVAKNENNKRINSYKLNVGDILENDRLTVTTWALYFFVSFWKMDIETSMSHVIRWNVGLKKMLKQ